MERAPEAPDAAPWTRGGLRISRAALAAVEADAVARYARDEEACGYLRGPAADPLRCDEHVALENLAARLHEMDPERYFRTARTYFEVNTVKLDKAVRAAVADGRPVKVLYHSHLDAGAYFSPTDAASMSGGVPPEREGGPILMGEGPAWPLAFLVTSVQGGAVSEHALFVWDGGARAFVPSRFTVTD